MNMKDKMAKMRASKAKKQASKKPAEEKSATKTVQAPIERDVKAHAKAMAEAAAKIPQEPQVKSWHVKIDMGMMPEEQFIYFFHYILPELRKAARQGKKITGFSWDEKRRLIPTFAKEEAFE